MKRIALLVFAAVAALGLAGRAAAQEAFAPLVQKETVSIVRINLDKIDSETLSTQLVKIAEAGIDYFVAEIDAKQATEVKKQVPLVAALAAQYFEMFVGSFKDAGVSEAFVVVEQSADPENTLYPYLAIPTAGMTEEQVKDVRAALATLNKNANFALKYRFVRNGFVYAVFIPETVAEADAKEYVKKRFGKTPSVDATAFVEGFKLVGDGAFLSGVNLLSKSSVAVAEQQLEALGGEADLARAFVEKMLETQKEIATLAKYNAWKIDLAELEIVSFIQTNSAADAQEYIKLLDGIESDLAELLSAVWKPALEIALNEADSDQVEALKAQTEKVNSAFLAVVAAFFDGMKADGATISLVIDEKFFADNEDAFKGLVKTVQALMKQAQAVDRDAEADDLELDSF